jgi:hypothetical protein
LPLCHFATFKKSGVKRRQKASKGATLPLCHFATLPLCHFATLPLCHFATFKKSGVKKEKKSGVKKHKDVFLVRLFLKKP